MFLTTLKTHKRALILSNICLKKKKHYSQVIFFYEKSKQLQKSRLIRAAYETIIPQPHFIVLRNTLPEMVEEFGRKLQKMF